MWSRLLPFRESGRLIDAPILEVELVRTDFFSLFGDTLKVSMGKLWIAACEPGYRFVCEVILRPKAQT